jgi:hypothetical protein
VQEQIEDPGGVAAPEALDDRALPGANLTPQALGVLVRRWMAGSFLVLASRRPLGPG